MFFFLVVILINPFQIQSASDTIGKVIQRKAYRQPYRQHQRIVLHVYHLFEHIHERIETLCIQYQKCQQNDGGRDHTYQLYKAALFTAEAVNEVKRQLTF